VKLNRFSFVFILTLVYFFVELVGGLHYNSLALVTDAAFMAINIISQLVAMYVKKLSRKPPDRLKTFGYERARVISGLFNGILIGFMVFYVLTRAYDRIIEPEHLFVNQAFVIAIIGLLVNGFGVYQLHDDSKDIGVKGAYLFILNDALGSVGLIISYILIKITGLYVFDAIASIVIALLVIYPTYFLVKDSLHILMEGIPSGIDLVTVEKFIYENFDHAKKVKELHIWSLVPEKKILTAKIRTDGRDYDRETIKTFKQRIKEKFEIQDVYLEVYEED
jgi:cobalt-zinc-cadmium efflux system protein